MDYITGLTNINKRINKKYKINPKVIGLRIKKIRLKEKLTQAELAKHLNTSQSNISAYENGKNIILTPIDVYYLCDKNSDTMFLIEHEAMEFIKERMERTSDNDELLRTMGD